MKTDKEQPVTRTPDWERLHEVIKFSGMSVNAFALHIGLPRSENLYQIKKGNHGISKVLAETINRYYPGYSVGWLLSGDPGAKLPLDADRIELRNDSLKRIPIHNRVDSEARPIYSIYISEDVINGSETAIINRDDSLSPRVPLGALIFLKPATHLITGRFYLIQTAEFTLVRKVRITKYPEEIRLEPIDRSHYDDITIDRAQIQNLYSVEKIIGDL